MPSSYCISPSSFKGLLRIPSSKSQTLRAILFAALASGTSTIRFPLGSPDTEAMIGACRLLGAKIVTIPEGYSIEGTGGKIQGAEDVIQVGNSGIVLRFLSAVAALGTRPVVLTGDASIRSRRPMQPLLSALQQLQGKAISTGENGFAPCIIQGPIASGTATLDGSDSQPVSAMLIACALGKGPFTLKVRNPGELPWIDVTLSWLDFLNLPYQRISAEHYELPGNGHITAFDYQVPGDFSSALFPIVAALTTQSEVTLENLDFADPQGDKAVIDELIKMGANLVVDCASRTLRVLRSSDLKGRTIDVNPFIDALPALAVLACYAKGETRLWNAAVAREKECDRITALATELKKMGADLEAHPDGLTIRNSRLSGSQLHSYQDHRMVMALSAAALGAEGSSRIHDIDSVNKTFPGFAASLQALGANIEIVA